MHIYGCICSFSQTNKQKSVLFFFLLARQSMYSYDNVGSFSDDA